MSDSGWLEEEADDLNLLDDLQAASDIEQRHQGLGHVIIKMEPGVTRCTCGVIITGEEGSHELHHPETDS